MSIAARLEQDELRPERELAALMEQADGDGAIVTFVGIARAASKQGQPVSGLVLEHHPTLTERTLQDIASDAFQRFGVSHVRVVHRSGTIRAGEAIVFAGAASQHRRNAFDAADYLMDRLKTEAIFWKCEKGEGSSTWIEPTEADYADRQRWE